MQVILYFYLQNKSNKNNTMKQFVIILLTLSTLTACKDPKPKENIQSKTSKTTSMNKKETALAFVKAVTNQDEKTVRELVNSDYIQHNPFLPTGLSLYRIVSCVERKRN